MLEESLRDAFAERAGQPTAMDDPAGRAIARARQIHRRQVVVGGMAGVCVVAFVLSIVAAGLTAGSSLDHPVAAGSGSVGITPAASNPPPSAQVTTPLARPVDLVDKQLHTAQGRTLKLPPLDSTRQAYKVTDGWLIVGSAPDAGTTKLWYVEKVSESVTELVTAATSIAVAADGGRVAWSLGRLMTVAVRSGDRLRDTRTTAAPESGGPIRFIGSGVLLGHTTTGGGTDSYDMWYPDRGEYKPTPGPYVAVFGGLPGGKDLIALTSGANANAKQLCLVRVAAATMTAVRTACDLVTILPAFGWVSPDGRWLVLPQGDKVVGYDLTTVFDDQKTAATWELRGVGADAAWLDPGTLVLRSGMQLHVLTMTNPKRIETYQIGSTGQVIVGQ